MFNQTLFRSRLGNVYIGRDFSITGETATNSVRGDLIASIELPPNLFQRLRQNIDTGLVFTTT